MKTKYILTVLVTACVVLHLNGINPVMQYTLTNPCTPSVTISSISDTYGCYSFVADNGIATDPDSYYVWDFGDNTTASGKTVYHCYSPSTNVVNYTISLSYQSPSLCGVLPTVQNFILIVNPPASGLCVMQTPSVTLNNYSVTVYAGFAIPEIMTRYFYGDGFWSASDNSHVYSNCGNYIITVKSWDMNMPNDTCYGYNAVNISCDGATVINEQDANAFIFPNPFTDFILFEATEAIKQIVVIDIAGREVCRKDFNFITSGKLNLSALPAGVYSVVFTFKNGLTHNRKLIKD